MSKAPYFAPWTVDADAFSISGCSADVVDSEGFAFAQVIPFEDDWTFGEVQRARLIESAPKLLKALKGLQCSKGVGLACLADVLNPCWNDRPTDKPGLHWGSDADNQIPACACCIARAAIVEAERTPPGRAEQSPDPSQSKEAKS